MAHKYDKGIAPYMFDAKTSWCEGAGTGKLSSKGFGSCVGLVLHCPSTKAGAVAHFSGSLGKDSNHKQARDDAQEILLAMRPVGVVAWNAWVFGGTSLSASSSSKSMVDALDLKTGTVEQTKGLITIVREVLDADPHYKFTYQTDGFPGHSAVSLDLDSGAVTFS
jgi:hypothetical protein